MVRATRRMRCMARADSCSASMARSSSSWSCAPRRQAASVPGSDKSVEGDLRASDGVFIVDAVNKRRYLAARDDQGVCLCTSVDRFESLGGNRSKVFSAIYRAIPDGVDTVAVTVPGAGTFTGVPVQ